MELVDYDSNQVARGVFQKPLATIVSPTVFWFLMTGAKWLKRVITQNGSLAGYLSWNLLSAGRSPLPGTRERWTNATLAMCDLKKKWTLRGRSHDTSQNAHFLLLQSPYTSSYSFSWIGVNSVFNIILPSLE